MAPLKVTHRPGNSTVSLVHKRNEFPDCCHISNPSMMLDVGL